MRIHLFLFLSIATYCVPAFALHGRNEMLGPASLVLGRGTVPKLPAAPEPGADPLEDIVRWTRYLEQVVDFVGRLDDSGKQYFREPGGRLMCISLKDWLHHWIAQSTSLVLTYADLVRSGKDDYLSRMDKKTGTLRVIAGFFRDLSTRTKPAADFDPLDGTRDRPLGFDQRGAYFIDKLFREVRFHPEKADLLALSSRNIDRAVDEIERSIAVLKRKSDGPPDSSRRYSSRSA
jgi:hypothetical protein